MTTYKSIIAQTNANGELEFRANKWEKPIISQFPMSTQGNKLYQHVLKEWEKTTISFKGANIYDVSLIKQAVIGSPEWKGDSPMNYKDGIDVTDFAEIRKRGHKDNLIGGLYAFYKSPSKEEPVTYHPDGSLSAHEVSRIKESVAEPEEDDEKDQIGIAEEIQDMFEQGKDWQDVLEKFEITRLPKA